MRDFHGVCALCLQETVLRNLAFGTSATRFLLATAWLTLCMLSPLFWGWALSTAFIRFVSSPLAGRSLRGWQNGGPVAQKACWGAAPAVLPPLSTLAVLPGWPTQLFWWKTLLSNVEV